MSSNAKDPSAETSVSATTAGVLSGSTVLGMNSVAVAPVGSSAMTRPDTDPGSPPRVTSSSAVAVLGLTAMSAASANTRASGYQIGENPAPEKRTRKSPASSLS